MSLEGEKVRFPPLTHSLVVLYGSQTGTACEVAEMLARRASRRGFAASVMSLDDFEVTNLPGIKYAIFVVSTTGEGEAPDNMKKFWRFLLRKSLPRDSLSGVNIGVLGLGDSGYTKFNAAAIRLRTRLLQLGAAELLDIGLGDDRSVNGVEADVEAWSKELWSVLLQIHPIPDGFTIDDSPIAEPPVIFRVVPENSISVFSRKVDGITNTQAMVDNTQAIVDKSISDYNCHFYDPPLGAYVYDDSTSSTTSLSNASVKPILARVKCNKRITAEDWEQDVRHVILQLPKIEKHEGNESPPGCSYTAGDVAVIYPENIFTLDLLRSLNIGSVGTESDSHLPSTSSPLDTIAYMLGLSPTQMISLGDATTIEHQSEEMKCKVMSPGWLPKICSVRSILRKYLDILGKPRRSFFEQLSLWATNEEEREKLLEMASVEGCDLYHDYVIRGRRNYIEVMSEFPSARPPLHQLLRIIPRLQPRLFSIASSQLELGYENEIHLIVALLQHKTAFTERRIVPGVCSSYISELQENDILPIWIQRGGLRLPGIKNAVTEIVNKSKTFSPQALSVYTTPIILVGPGTGVAPLRAMIQERWGIIRLLGLRQSKENKGNSRGTCDLYFGCRHEKKDFLFSSEWKARLKEEEIKEEVSSRIAGSLDHLHTAFSRDSISMGKVYVQHRMLQNSSAVWDVLSPTSAGSIYIAGSASGMVKGVRKALLEIFQKDGGMDEDSSKKYLRYIERKGRYQCEAWS